MSLARAIAEALIEAHHDVLLAEPACAHFRDKDFAMDGLAKVIQEVLDHDMIRVANEAPMGSAILLRCGCCGATLREYGGKHEGVNFCLQCWQKLPGTPILRIDPTPKPMGNPWVSHGQPTVQPMAEPTVQPTPKPPPAPRDCDA